MKPIIWRETKTLLTSWVSIIFHFVTPIFLLIFFATVLGRNLVSFSYNDIQVNYLDYFTPGLIGYITFMTFQMALTFVRHDRMSGILSIIVLSQDGIRGYISGKLFVQFAINIIKVTILIMIAFMISQGSIELFHFKNIILFVISIILGSATWLCLGLTIALLLKRDDIREVLIMIISMPLIFASSMYYDISRAPEWIQAISLINPLTYTCNLARKAYLLERVDNYFSDLIVMLILTLISLTLATFVSKKVEY